MIFTFLFVSEKSLFKISVNSNVVGSGYRKMKLKYEVYNEYSYKHC